MTTRVQDRSPARQRPPAPLHQSTMLERAMTVLGRVGPLVLRLTLGITFVWFGALKVVDATPVEQLVVDSLPWLSVPSWFLPAVGVFELAVGMSFVLGRGLRLLLPLFVGHMLATFVGVLAVQPEIAFQNGNPLLLTVQGEFVVKNLVLLAAGVVVGTQADLVLQPARQPPDSFTVVLPPNHQAARNPSPGGLRAGPW